MLHQIVMKNFKCFKARTEIPLKSINLLTGINGRGKSTALQSVLLMRQSLEHSRTTDHLIFNGTCVDIGNYDDIRNSDTSRNEPCILGFQYGADGNYVNLEYQLRSDEVDEMSARIEQLIIDGIINNQPVLLKSEYTDGYHRVIPGDEISEVYWRDLVFDRLEANSELMDSIRSLINFPGIHYVSADRIGPREYYPKQSFSEFPSVGRRGEYTPNVLYLKKDEVIADSVCHEKGVTKTLADQTQAWLSAIFDGDRIELVSTNANIVILSLNSEEGSRGYKPVNVGFGYSYALPIVVTCLVAKPGEIVIIENPEAHLHPYAQSKITQFLAKVCASGVQVFIESHSDHVLNALRLAVLDDIISTEDLNILYFGRDEYPTVTKIEVMDDGAIEQWPTGFFDQLDRDFERLFGA